MNGGSQVNFGTKRHLAALTICLLIFTGCSSFENNSAKKGSPQDALLSCAQILAEAHDNVKQMQGDALTARENSAMNSRDKLGMMMFAPVFSVPFLFMAASARETSGEKANDRVSEFGARNDALRSLGKKRHCDMAAIPSVGEIRKEAYREWKKRLSTPDESNLNDGPDFGERVIKSDPVEASDTGLEPIKPGDIGSTKRGRVETPTEPSSATRDATVQQLMTMFLRGEISQEEYNNRKARVSGGTKQ